MHVIVFSGIQAGSRCEIKGERVGGAFHEFHARLILQHAVVGHGKFAVHIVVGAEHFHGRAGGKAFFDDGTASDQAELGFHFSHVRDIGGPLADKRFHSLEVSRTTIGWHGAAGGGILIERLAGGQNHQGDDGQDKKDFDHRSVDGVKETRMRFRNTTNESINEGLTRGKKSEIDMIDE